MGELEWTVRNPQCGTSRTGRSTRLRLAFGRLSSFPTLLLRGLIISLIPLRVRASKGPGGLAHNCQKFPGGTDYGGRYSPQAATFGKKGRMFSEAHPEKTDALTGNT